MHSPTYTKTITTFSSCVRCSSLLWLIFISREFDPFYISIKVEMGLLTIVESRETKKKTLEEIASAFGDRVILPSERGDGKDDDDDGDKPDSQRVEAAVPVKDGD